MAARTAIGLLGALAVTAGCDGVFGLDESTLTTGVNGGASSSSGSSSGSGGSSGAKGSSSGSGGMSSSGGMTSSSGSAGSSSGGGTACAVVDNGSSTDANGNAAILTTCGRTGSWYVVNDGLTTQTPAAGASFGPFDTSSPPNGAFGYVRTFGQLATGTSAWGCNVGFNLNATPTSTGSYSARMYSGVSFWMKPSSSNTVSTYLFEVPTTQTYNLADGAFALVARVTPPTGVWTNVQVHWTDLAPAPWASASEAAIAFDPSQIIRIQWELASGSTAESFDISIGEIQFLP
jgi:hypothetical protein